MKDSEDSLLNTIKDLSEKLDAKRTVSREEGEEGTAGPPAGSKGRAHLGFGAADKGSAEQDQRSN